MIDYEALLPYVPVGDVIPKKLYQTYRSKTDFPQEIGENIAYLQSLNPDWEYRLYDDEDIKEFILSNYGGRIWKYYSMISPAYGAARADLFRYLLIYKEGGVYLDIKSTLTKPLDDILDPKIKFVLAHWDNAPDGKYPGFGLLPEVAHIPGGEYIQWAIISCAGHPYMRQMILQVLKNIDNYNPFTVGVGLFGVIRTTGPLAYSLAIEAERLKSPELCYVLPHVDELGLKYSIYEDLGPFQHKKALKSNYNIKLDAVINNGSERWTRWLYPYFYGRWVARILSDKCKQKLSSLFKK